MKTTTIILILFALAVIISGIKYYRKSNRYLKQTKKKVKQLKGDDIDYINSERPHY